MTTPQTPIDALAAQARACAESLRLISQTRRVQDACDVLEQCARALAAIPAQPNVDVSDLLKRAVDLHEKAGMPWIDAEELALSEAGIDDAILDELIGEAGYSGLESMLTTIDELRRFTRSVLVHQPLAALRASSPAERIEALEADRDSWIEQCSQRVADWSEAQARIEADEALMRTALEALDACRDWPGAHQECHAAITALRKRLESSK